MTFLFLATGIVLIIVIVQSSKVRKEKLETEKVLASLKNEFTEFRENTEYLKKYQAIKDIEAELNRIHGEIVQTIEDASSMADMIKSEASEEVDKMLQQAKRDAKEIREKAQRILEDAHSLSAKIDRDAKATAERIAGEAWEAKENADQYSETVKAMKNIIKGYGDEYLIPNHSLLDELADEYSHKDAGVELAQTRSLIKSMIKNGEAATCDYAENNRRKTAIEFVLDAFNGKVESIMSKVKHDNYGKLLQSLKDAFRIVNHNGQPFRNARIRQRYFDVILEQLTLAVTVKELKKQDLEEQRQIREAIREEEKARRDFEKAIKATEKEEKILEKAIKETEAKLKRAAADERVRFEAELEEIKQKLADAEERGQRALSMAQQTKRGHVYIISNVGSFGENVLKIGLTRRLEPMDRIKELGDASVPFSFDVHAMIHSEDAPKLEKELHETFEQSRLNKINYRKEFFTLPIHEIKSIVDQMGLEAHWTMKADAREYRESQELKRRELTMAQQN